MKCSVKNCENEAINKSLGKGKCAFCYLDSVLFNTVRISEWEAYVTWVKLTDIPDMPFSPFEVEYRCNLTDEEIESALFGYWNEHVRGKA